MNGTVNFRIAPDGRQRKRYKFGPNGRAVYMLVALLESASPDEWEGLAAYPVDKAAKDSAKEAASGCMRKSSRGGFRHTAGLVVKAAARYAPGDTGRFATVFDYQSAALAAVVADLVGQHGYTQEHHDLLLGPVREVFGTDWDRVTKETS